MTAHQQQAARLLSSLGLHVDPAKLSPGDCAKITQAVAIRHRALADAAKMQAVANQSLAALRQIAQARRR